jgi:hypothetical protein
MPRQRRSDKAVADIAKRFITAAQEHLGLAPGDLWRALGYANSSTVHSVTKGETLPDFVRIAEHQGAMRDARGRSLNLHWVITGQGSPVVGLGRVGGARRASTKEAAENDIIVKLRRMKPSRRATLVKFLDEFS